jgi:hypothetical protein
MRFTAASVCLLQLLASSASAFSPITLCGSSRRLRIIQLATVPGADIEQDVPGSLPQAAESTMTGRGKVNEIDFCIAPADVSLSRAYSQSSSDGDEKTTRGPKTMSLTRALNNASNRAVRRILLARCWPSAEALNLSLRLVALAEKQAREEMAAAGSTSSMKCPVPRPILNILMRRQSDRKSDPSLGSVPVPRTRTNEQYVADQLSSFRERYGNIPGFDYAETYLEAVLSLATCGEESVRINEVSRMEHELWFIFKRLCLYGLFLRRVR